MFTTTSGEKRMSKIILSGFILVNEEDLEAVLAELPNHIKLTREEPGCLVFDVDRDAGDPAKFMVYEEFIDQDAFDRHQARVKASCWGEVASNVDRHYEIKSV